MIETLIKNAEIENFRNYEKSEISFFDGVNIIYGQNAAGKTNIIEALYFFSQGRSFRSSISEVIRHGHETAKIGVSFSSAGRDMDSRIIFEKGKKRSIELNGVLINKTSRLLGNLICVLFTPDEMELIKSGPEKRRRFADSAVIPLKPTYVSLLNSYNSILNQKTALLRRGKYETLDAWNEKQSETGSRIIHIRKSYMEKLCAEAGKIHFEFSDGAERLEGRYVSSVTVKETVVQTQEEFYKKLYEAKDREIALCMPLVGPQRDDFQFKINSFSARAFSSQGQQRSVCLSLKTAQAEIIKEKTGQYPVLLLDDVMSELDKARREFLVKKLYGKQVIITCTDVNGAHIKDAQKLIFVEKGRIYE
ncbi:MAG: DNA replication/repair protein RecF [Clostridia bacterium]|nr:DNA replication/repair protein RecF [Clostridia bacterium]